MGTEDAESRDLPPSTPENEANPQSRAAHGDKAAQGQPDARALVERLVAAGRWPAPDLLHQILNAGESAIEPLRGVLRTDAHGWPAKAPIVHAIRLLSTLHPPAVIPELVSIVRRYMNKLEAEAAEALTRFGTPGFDALLDLCRDPSIDGYRRVDVAWAAITAAGDDPVKRARVAEQLRSILEQLVADARELAQDEEPVDLSGDEEEFHGDDCDHRNYGQDKEVIDEDVSDPTAELDDDWDEEEDLEDEEDWDEIDLVEDDENWGEDGEFDDDGNDVASDVRMELAFVVSDLADLADPLALDLIKTAFDEELVDSSFMDQEEVDEQYRRGGITPSAKTDWLESYQRSYDKHVEALEPSVLPPPNSVRRPRYRYEDRYDEGEPPPDAPATAPILNTGPRLGRNDPCWCGSGKKYKRCHLGKGPAG
jgi:hypothetical protein